MLTATIQEYRTAPYGNQPAYGYVARREKAEPVMTRVPMLDWPVDLFTTPWNDSED